MRRHTLTQRREAGEQVSPTNACCSEPTGSRTGLIVLVAALMMLAVGCSRGPENGAFELAADGAPSPDNTVAVEIGGNGEGALRVFSTADDADQVVGVDANAGDGQSTSSSTTTTAESTTTSSTPSASTTTAVANQDESAGSSSTVTTAAASTSSSSAGLDDRSSNSGNGGRNGSGNGNRNGNTSPRNQTSTTEATRATTSTARATTSTARATTSTARATTSTVRATTSTARATTSTTRATTSTTRATTSTTRATTSTTRATTSTTQATTSTTVRLPDPSGDVIYVDRNAGSGGNGSQAAPYNTLTKGLDEVKPGQTLIVKGGEYRERIKLGVGGKATSSSKPILVQAAPGERVVVKGLLNIYNPDYWTIRGINVTWDNERNNSSEHMVLLKNGRNWVFEKAEVWGARGYSGLLVVGTPSNFTVRDLHVHDTYRSNGTHQDHLIYCNCGSGGGVIERNLLVGSANGRGIKIGTPNDSYPSIANVKVRYNTIVDNSGPSNIQLSYKTSNITIENNILVSPKDGLPNVTGRNLSGGGNNVVRNNIGWDSIGVVEGADKLTDGGGNRRLDPGLDGNYAPTNPDARSYGHRAP